jgi:hypothetical protein
MLSCWGDERCKQTTITFIYDGFVLYRDALSSTVASSAEIAVVLEGAATAPLDCAEQRHANEAYVPEHTAIRSLFRACSCSDQGAQH